MSQDIVIYILLIGMIALYLCVGWIFYTEHWKIDKRIYYHYVWFILFSVVVIPLWALENVHKLLSKEV